MAIKSMPLVNAEQSDVADLQQEIDIMRKLSHPNIVRYFGAELSEEEGVLNIFQEWVPGGSVASLLSRLGAFSVNVVRSYLRQVLLGLEYLHSHRIIHRDIKGGNILVDNSGTVKLADFGASKKMNEEGTLDVMGMSMKGTPYFMAPEVLEREKYGRKADMWSTGGVAFQMITGEAPWKSLGLRTPVSLFYHIQTTDDPPPIPEFVQDIPGLSRIILKCFNRDPAKRPRATELLKDEFFEEVEEEDDDDDEEEDEDEDGMEEEEKLEDGTADGHIEEEAGVGDNEGGFGEHLAGGNAEKELNVKGGNKREIKTGAPSAKQRLVSDHVVTGNFSTPKMAGRNQSRHFENGYVEVDPFCVRTAKKRAELRSKTPRSGSSNLKGDGRTPKSGNAALRNSPAQQRFEGGLGLNDLLPAPAERIREIGLINPKPVRPATMASANPLHGVANEKVTRKKERPKTTTLEREKSEYHSVDEIPNEWPSWAKQKAAVIGGGGASNAASPYPSSTHDTNSPLSVYGTPTSLGDFEGGGGANPFAHSNGQLNPFGGEEGGGGDSASFPGNGISTGINAAPAPAPSPDQHKHHHHKPQHQHQHLAPKPSIDSPTMFMKGPSVKQFKRDSEHTKKTTPSPSVAVNSNMKENNADSSGSVTLKVGAKQVGAEQVDSIDVKPTAGGMIASAEEEEADAAVGELGRGINKPVEATEDTADSTGAWICSNCGASNEAGLPYCGSCAMWRSVRAKTGDKREGKRAAREEGRREDCIVLIVLIVMSSFLTHPLACTCCFVRYAFHLNQQTVVTVGAAWSSMQKKSEVAEDENSNSIGAVRHQQSRAKVAARANKGGKSAQAGRAFRKKYNIAKQS